MNENARESTTNLRKNSGIAYLASIDSEGYPVLRAMLVLEHDSRQFLQWTEQYKIHN